MLERATYKTIVHGDAKVANFCFPSSEARDKGAGVGAVDFQYCGYGIGVRDVVYFLRSVFSESQLLDRAEEMHNFYFQVLQDALPQGPIPQLEQEWRYLIPLCIADFQRFLHGWKSASTSSTGKWQKGLYTQRMCEMAEQIVTQSSAKDA